MPPQATSTTPTPTTPSTPRAPPSGQQSIRGFLRAGGIRQVVANAFEIAQERGAEGGIPREDPDNMEVEDEEYEQESGNTNRKRMREDPTDSPVIDAAMSDSMIANTSIEHDNRRRRVSSTNPDVLETPITSSPQVLQLLAEINQTTQNSIPLLPNETIQHPNTASDSSTQSNLINIRGMVDGINSIVRQAIHEQPLPTQRLEWDDACMPPTLPHLSPRPTPGIVDASPELQSTQAGDDNGTEKDDTDDIVSRLRKQFDEAIDDACKRIGNLTDQRLASLKIEICSNTEQRMANIEESIRNNEDHENRIQTNSDQLEAQQGVIQGLTTAMGEADQNILTINGQINQHSEVLHDTRENIDRLEQAVHILQRNTAAPTQNTQLQPLLDRISALEEANKDAARTIEMMRIDKERQEDFHFMKTISVRRFRIPNRASNRSMARRILDSIGCGDILSNVEIITFSNRRDNMRLTFPSIQAVNDAVHWLAEGIKREKDNGHNPSLEFSIMTPPRFSEDRKILTRIGLELKAAGQCRRFSFFIQNGKLKMRLTKPGSRDKIIETPNEDENRMDTDQSAEPNGCPICKTAYAQEDKIAIYACGHTFHSLCLETALEADLKCPVCREIPDFPIPTEDLEKCEECVNTDYQNREMLCASSKCLHLHTIGCHHSHLREYDITPPSTTEFVAGVRMDEEFIGCRICSKDIIALPIFCTLMYYINYTDNIPGFINISHMRPWETSRENFPRNLTAQFFIPQTSRVSTRREPTRRNIATGANNEPIRDRSPRDSSTRSRRHRESRTRDEQMRGRYEPQSSRGRRDHTNGNDRRVRFRDDQAD